MPKLASKMGFLPAPAADVSLEAPYRKLLYIMRGPPGCGKSTAARRLLAQHLKAQGVRWGGAVFSPLCRAFVLSTDDFCTELQETGEAKYKYDPRKHAENHKRNQTRCEVAMELGITPLFVDNTNISLWEMREYVRMADRFRYKIHIVDPRRLSTNALDPEALEARCKAAAAASDGGCRALGKEIPRHVFERMAANFAEIPEDEGEIGCALETIRASQSPHDASMLPRYAGLDVEARALAALGAVELGPLFWEVRDGGHGREEQGPPPGVHYFDARYREGGEVWRLPDRLHVTVKFFRSKEVDAPDRVRAQALVDSWHPVVATSLVFIRGGGLLCAACEAGSGDGLQAMRTLAGKGWVPHITLLTCRPWAPVESTAVINAWSSSATQPTLCPEADCAGVHGETASIPETVIESSATVAESVEVGESAGDDTEEVPLPGGRRCQVRRGVHVDGKDGVFDLCQIPLQPPLSLGLCQFKMFFK